MKLEETNVLGCKLSRLQIECLFNSIANSRIVNIKDLGSIQFDHVSPEVLAEALVRIETVESMWKVSSEVIDEYLPPLLRKIASTERVNLKSLGLHWVDLSRFSVSLVSEAVLKLEKIFTENSSFTSSLAIEVFERLSHCKQPKLKALHLKGEDLQPVPTDLLANALTSLESVELPYCNYSPDQLQTLFSKLAAEEKPLRHLVLAKERPLQHLDLDSNKPKQVKPELLVTAISKLESVTLRGLSLGTDQLTSLYRMVAEKRSGRLKKLGLSFNDQSSVPQSLIDQAKLNKNVLIF